MRNLIQLCSDKIGISINHIGNLPETREVSHYLLNIPRFLDTEVGGKYFNAVEGSLSGLLGVPEETRIEQWSGIDFTDDEIEELIGFIEGLDEGFLPGQTGRSGNSGCSTGRKRWLPFSSAEVSRTSCFTMHLAEGPGLWPGTKA
ncbi:MAG TPA: hypothetical protein ENH50_01030, partial [Nitrospirae bacterium]|nr:hypothetical protein [Nitrospirota bacterium]